MAAIEFSAKEILSRVRQAVPDANENYVINLINQGLVDMGRYSIKTEYGDNGIIKNNNSLTASILD